MEQTAFERYAPFIQAYIYRKKWTDLRQVQVEACEAILDTEDHVIIASGTASGKTEAAFFPMLTLLEKKPSQSVGILYIGPLKALINDQFCRLKELLEDSGIPVWPWHGDVSQSMKLQALKNAQGVLQITPESLEALLMRHPGDARRLFSDLRFVVIDEIHALMGQDRGLQVLCLLTRLERLTGCRPRRIGLSATLNDYIPAMDFLGAGTGRKVTACGIQSQRRTISLCVESFVLPEEEAAAQAVMERYNNFLYDNTHLQKCLIFTNSRKNAEVVISDMKAIAARRREQDVFYVHHGSVSAMMRQEAESALKDTEGPAVAAATLTLELGIDIGDLDSTVQLGAPFTCASFVQRLGRSGRRSGKSRMMFVHLLEPSAKSPLAALPWPLLQSIAIIQLYLEERWVEPFRLKEKPFSLLAHQTLSTLMAEGELPPPVLAERVLTLPPFRGTVTQEEYRQLLRFMLSEDYIQKMESGGIIPGLKGERIANHYSFYAVFQDEKTYSVIAKEGEIGTLTRCPAIGDIFTLAGRSWQVVSIDEKRKRVLVIQSAASQVPSWAGTAGDVHGKIIRRMRQVLQEDMVYPYLQPDAAALLADARKQARSLLLTEQRIIPIDHHSFFLCPWCGTRELRTIARLFSCGLKEPLEILRVTNSNYYLEVTSGLEISTFLSRLRSLAPDTEDPALILPANQAPRSDRYDAMVPEPLLREAYLHNRMDLPEAIKILQSLSI